MSDGLVKRTRSGKSRENPRTGLRRCSRIEFPMLNWIGAVDWFHFGRRLLSIDCLAGST